MTPKEFREIISKSQYVGWFNKIDEEINFAFINSKKKFTSVSALFEFVSGQVNGWENLTGAPQSISQFYRSIQWLKKPDRNFHQQNRST